VAGRVALTPSVHRASDLLQYVPEELKIASLDVKPPLFDFDEESARREEDALRTARGFFWTKEFARASFILKDCKSSKARFFALYTKFLVRQPLWLATLVLTVVRWPKRKLVKTLRE
jgi:hypothetical protein